MIERAPALRAALLGWWDAGHAELPWRRTRDPYAIWVAEIMLQQTQIATVIPFYERWMARYPTVTALAEAPLDAVLKQWEGLGYYARARNLHAAAREVVVRHEGQVPGTVPALRALKGIGRYTAGAIASVAFDRPVPAVDGNVIRVLSRLADLAEDVTRPATQRLIWDMAGKLVDPRRPGDFNQALMELGQRICLPAAPRCVACPWSDACLARARGSQPDRPVRPPRARTPHFHVVAGVIRRGDGRLLITRRPLDGLLGGLWEFPGGKQEDGETLPQALVREIREELAVEIAVGEPLAIVRHAYTHFRITLHAYYARLIDGRVRHLGVIDHAWVDPDALDDYAFAATDRKIIAALRGGGPS